MFDMETVTTSAPSGRKSLTMMPDLTRLPEISSAPVTAQHQTLTPMNRQPDSDHQGEEGETNSMTSPGMPVAAQKLIPDIFSSSITDMLPDSQSDIVSPHVWQKLYKNKKPGQGERSECSPSPAPVGTFNEEFPDLPLTKQDRKILLGSVSIFNKLHCSIYSSTWVARMFVHDWLEQIMLFTVV